MKTPRESFLLTGKAADFKKLVAHDAFEPACNHAMLQLLYEMTPNRLPGLPIDPYAGIVENAKLEGAQRVLDILKTIAEPIIETPPTKRESLHY